MHHRIPRRGQHLGRVATTYPAAVLSQRHGPNPMQTILDTPRTTHQLQKPLGVRLGRRQTADALHGLFFHFIRQMTDAMDLKNL